MRFKAARNPRLRRARLFLRLIEHKTLARADPLKGKFCSFLFTSFKNYLCTEAERSHRHKRGGHYEFVSLDLEDAENRYRLEATDTLSAEKIFDARWALTLLGRTMTRLAEEYAIRGRASQFETLKVFLKAGGSCSPSYEEAAKALRVPARSPRFKAQPAGGAFGWGQHQFHKILRDKSWSDSKQGSFGWRRLH